MRKNHISESIDQLLKDSTKGKAAPMGGVTYLSLEENEVGLPPTIVTELISKCRPVPRMKWFRGMEHLFRRREDHRCACRLVRNPEVRCFPTFGPSVAEVLTKLIT